MRESLSVRLPNWLGDTVMAVPALRALRLAHSGARVALAGPWAPLLAGQGLGDLLVPYPRAWGARRRAGDVMRRFGADTAVLLPNSFEAALAAVYWGARWRVGYAWGGRSWLLTDAVRSPAPRLHQTDEYRRLVERLGASASEGTPRLTPPDPGSPERRRARALLADAGIGAARGAVVGVHLGAAYGNAKVWAADRAVEFCRAMLDTGRHPVLLGGPDDARDVEAVGARAGVPSLAGRDGPELLAALLAELDALVAGDTGVAHLAAALGTPVVALFGPTDPARSAPRGPVEILRHPVPCAPCFYRACPIEHPCMRLLTAARVAESVDALLGARP